MDKLITENRAYACVDCGKCTGICPVARYNPEFSPRKVVQNSIFDSSNPEPWKDGQLWECITCSACEAICNSDVHFTGIIRELRHRAFEHGVTGHSTHGGALQSLMRIMTSDNLAQSRVSWLPEKLQTKDTSKVLYFAGCQPYFDNIFKDMGINTLSIAKGAMELLNQTGITPTVSPNERCCGHDMLWSGDIDTFRKLARHNVEEIKKTGASIVVVTCPECLYTLKEEYPRYLGNIGFEVVHLSEVVSDSLNNGNLKFGPTDKKITFHDPCRLGRFSGLFDEPRNLLQAIPGLELVEMSNHRNNSLCCGTQAWANCGAVNKRIQNELLADARATGANTLITACPKCQIHLKCAMRELDEGSELRIDIQDMTSFAAGLLLNK